LPKQVISTSAAPSAIGPYSQAIRAGQFVFVSGQVPFNPSTGELVTGSIEEETTQVMENVKAVLDAAGLTMADIVKTSIFLTDLGNFAQVNEVYGSYFTDDPPARATIQVAALPRGARVEVEAVAMFS
jgi:2-iminobutanoate/2-iminopropanoate deaminase